MGIVRENLDFERGKDPKEAMGIGRVVDIMGKDPAKEYRVLVLHPLKDELENQKRNPNSMDIGSMVYRAEIQKGVRKGEKIIVRKFDEPFGKYWGIEWDLKLKESLTFERGMDPKDAILGPKYRMFSIIHHQMLNIVKSIAEKYNASIIDESDQEILKVGVITPVKKGKIFITLGREDIINPGTHINDMAVGYYLENGKKTSGIGASVGKNKEGLEKYEYELQEAIKIVESWLKQDATGIVESLNFERDKNPKEVMGLGLPTKIKKGLLSLSNERGISIINLKGDRDSAWLEITDYIDNEKTFLNCVEKNFGIDFFSDINIKPIQKKLSKIKGRSWRTEHRLIIKPEFKELFKNAFDPAGFIKESINFERGKDPKQSMDIGLSRERIIKEIKKYDPKDSRSKTVSGYYFSKPTDSVRFSFNWNSNLESVGIDYLFDFLKQLRNSPTKKIHESQNFQRGGEPKEAMDIGISRFKNLRPGNIFKALNYLAILKQEFYVSSSFASDIDKDSYICIGDVGYHVGETVLMYFVKCENLESAKIKSRIIKDVKNTFIMSFVSTKLSTLKSNFEIIQ